MEFLYHLLATTFTGLEPESVQFTSQILRIIGFLGILSVLAILFSRFYKGKRILARSSNDSGKIQIADTHSLGNRQFLIVAEYDCEKHLLGVSPSGIQHLTSLTSKEKASQDKSEN